VFSDPLIVAIKIYYKYQAWIFLKNKCVKTFWAVLEYVRKIHPHLLLFYLFCRSIFSLVSSFLLLLNHFRCCSSAFTCFSSLHLQSTLFLYFVFICLCFCSFPLFLSYFFSRRIFILCLYTSIHTPTPPLWTRKKLCLLCFKQYEYLKRQISKSASKLRCT